MNVIIPTVSKKKKRVKAQNLGSPLVRALLISLGHTTQTCPKVMHDFLRRQKVTKKIFYSFSSIRKRTKKTARPGPIKSSPKRGVLQLASLKQIKRLFRFERFL